MQRFEEQLHLVKSRNKIFILFDSASEQIFIFKKWPQLSKIYRTR